MVKITYLKSSLVLYPLMLDISLNFVQQKLKDYQPSTLEIPDLKASAVLVLLLPEEKGEGFRILMTARSQKVHHHAGEMSFPGGRQDAEDPTLRETALRETFEEIGIQEDEIDLIGQLDDFPTITGFLVRPYIGILKTLHPLYVKSEDEVDEIVELPISYLTQPDLFHEAKIPRGEFEFSVLSFAYFDPHYNKKFTIWGATAHLLAQFVLKIYGISVYGSDYRRPTLEEIRGFFRERGQKTALKAEDILPSTPKKDERKT